MRSEDYTDLAVAPLSVGGAEVKVSSARLSVSEISDAEGSNQN